MSPPSEKLSYVDSARTPMRQRPKPANAVLAEAEAQWIFSQDELLHTPSIVDGMPPEKERELRYKGTNFIMQVGIALKLPQLTLSTAAVFLNRFLMRRSLVAKDGIKPLHHYEVAATSLFLATKVEETCRRMKEMVVACCRVAQKNPNLLVDEQTKDFWRWRDTILFNEDVLLETICFDLTVEAPHKLLFEMLKDLGAEHNKRLRGAAWGFINDSVMTQLCLLFTSRTIAAAAVYCAAKHCEVAFPDDEDGRAWWEVQHVELRDIRRACNYMASVFEETPARSGNESIYVGLRTPEDGDPRYAKTRLRRSQTPQTPGNGMSGGTLGGGGVAGRAVSMSRTASGSSDAGVKRTMGENGREQNGLGRDFEDVKRARVDSDSHQLDAGVGGERKESNGVHYGSAAPEAPENGTAMNEEGSGSEEGEVEE